MQNVAPAAIPGDPSRKLEIPEHDSKPSFQTEYRSKVGSLNHLTNQTRPDIAFQVGYSGKYNSRAATDHNNAVNQIYQYLQRTTNIGLFFPRTNEKLTLECFVDADHANCLDTRRSTGGGVFFLGKAPVSWFSRRQTFVATSTCHAEYGAAADNAREAVWLMGFINDLAVPEINIGNVVMYIDNNAALKLTRNPEGHSRNKHVELRHHYIRMKVKEGVLVTKRVDTQDNVADILTKPLKGILFEKFRQRLVERFQG
ncbi:hypothetical protein NUW58_g7892 [Xylaria curta]|uniref:Uncharacterized protein n=1 Tax=Xylaria curta TaxID=42375 RepID=A0ACC1NE21_9PEZI|nr:hypothetical protein NUW58_g7892 [Xylaria curta]